LRKAQGGINAAVLVAVIAGLIILYILFLPEKEREDLLENKNKTGQDGTTGNGNEEVVPLLKEFPGRLDTVSGITDKTVPNIFLFERTDAKELEKINPFMVRNGWFDKKSNTASFSIEDLENTDNVILAFNAKKHNGILTIKLNDAIIYENEIETETVAPIKLNRNLLKDQNVLEFSVSSVGIKFWKTNEYSLEDVRVIGDITDRSKQESRNVFTLTGTEVFNIEKADLRFVPYCKNVASVGVLDISINERNIYSAVPVCEDPTKVTIPVGILDEGENKVIFKTNKGSYSVEQVKVEFQEKDIKTNVYYFEVNRSVMNDIKNRKKDAILTIEFVDDNANKKADLNINNRLSAIDQEKSIFTKTLNDKKDPDYVEEGNNFVEIRPRTRLNIVELRVELKNI